MRDRGRDEGYKKRWKRESGDHAYKKDRSKEKELVRAWRTPHPFYMSAFRAWSKEVKKKIRDFKPSQTTYVNQLLRQPFVLNIGFARIAKAMDRTFDFGRAVRQMLVVLIGDKGKRLEFGSFLRILPGRK